MSINCSVYLVHYEPLLERLEFMTDQFCRLNIDSFKVISSEPPDSAVSADVEAVRKKLRYFHNNSPSCISKQEASLAWKHYEFIKLTSENSSGPSLVLEDDAILSDNFKEVVNHVLRDNVWDVVFLGSGCNLRKSGNGLIRVPHPASKCTDSYILTHSAAKKILSTLSFPIDLAIDWELNYQMMQHDLKVFWLEPPIVRQGSQDGTWYSSINNKKENLFV